MHCGTPKATASWPALVIALIAILLSACSGQKTASKGNFKTAIQAYFDTLPGACVTPPAETVPFRLSARSIGFLAPTRQDRAEALVAAGLLTRTALPHAPQADAENEFQLTAAGSKALVKGAGTNVARGDAFCTGKYRVKEVVSFTEPGDLMGTRVSRVTHTYTVEGAADWARNAVLQQINPQLRHVAPNEARKEALLILRNDGWVDDRASGL